MLGDRWGADTVLNLTAAETALRASLLSKYPDLVNAADSYARLYGMQFTDAVRFVIGASGDGYSSAMKSAVIAEVSQAETMDSQSGTVLGNQIPWLPIAVGAGLLLLFSRSR